MKDYRAVFSKKGALIYTSHLDLNHALIRTFNRASLPIKCTEGFNPHAKIVFALPLSVGMAGENELVDFSLTSDDISNEQLADILNKNLPRDIVIKKIIQPEIKFKHIKSALYEIKFFKSHGISDEITAFLKKSPLNVIKNGKDGEKQIEISSQIGEFSVCENNSDTILRIKLSAAPDNYLNPECIVSGLRAQGIFSGEEYYISREEIIFEDRV